MHTDSGPAKNQAHTKTGNGGARIMNKYWRHLQLGWTRHPRQCRKWTDPQMTLSPAEKLGHTTGACLEAETRAVHIFVANPSTDIHTVGGAKTTGGQSNLTTGCIAATHERLNGTCQVVLACTPPYMCIFGPTRVLNPNIISIGSAVFAGLIIVTEWLADLVLHCGLKTIHWPLLVRHTPDTSPGSVTRC